MHQHIQINHHKVIFTSYTTNFIVTVRNLAKELMEPHCFFHLLILYLLVLVILSLFRIYL